MARESDRFEHPERPAHDGAVRCSLCIETGAGTDPGWCPAARTLVCDDCCVALLHGDVMRFIAVTSRTGGTLTPDSLFMTCADCDRAQRHAADHMLSADPAAEDTPAC